MCVEITFSDGDPTNQIGRLLDILRKANAIVRLKSLSMSLADQDEFDIRLEVLELIEGAGQTLKRRIKSLVGVKV